MATVFELVRSASAMLRASGVDTPEHDAKLLAAEVFGVDLQTVDKAMLMGSETSELAKQGAKQSGEDAALKRFHTMVDRRSKREPLQHITGHAPFRYLDLKVGPGVFIPRQETELVVQEGVDWITNTACIRRKWIDLCGGKRRNRPVIRDRSAGSEVWAVEKSEQTAQWTASISTKPQKSTPASPATIIWKSLMPRKCRH